MVTPLATSKFNLPLVEHSPDPSAENYLQFLQVCYTRKTIQLYFCASESIRRFIGFSPEISFDVEITHNAGGAILPKLSVTFHSVPDAPQVLEARFVPYENDRGFRKVLKIIAESELLIGQVILIHGDETWTFNFISEPDETLKAKIRDQMAYL